MSEQVARREAAAAGGEPPWRDPPALLPWALGLMAGIALERAVPLEPRLATAAMTAVPILLLLRRLRPRAVGAVAFLCAACCGAVLHHRAYRAVSPDDIVHWTSAEPRLARVSGRVMETPTTRSGGYAPFEPWLYRLSYTTLMLDVDGVESESGFVPASGRLRVSVKEALLSARGGDRIEAFGWLMRTRPPRNPGAFDWAEFQARHGVRAELSCERAEAVRLLESAGGLPWWSRTRLRNWARRLLLDERLERGGTGLSVLDAMVLGRRTVVDRAVERAFVDTGCAHYLAVSGVNVAMLALAIWLPARMLGWTKRRTAWLVMLIVAGYALIADPRPPILRAAIMVITYGIGLMLRRPRALVSGLLLAAMIILAADPPALFDVGFQLSFVTVAGIIALQPALADVLIAAARRLRRMALREHPVSPEIERIAAQFAPYPGLRRWARGFAASVALTLAAWLCALPITAANFARTAPWGWLNSLVVSPLVFAVMVLGYARLALGALAPAAADALDPLLDLSVSALLGLLGRLPSENVPMPPPPLWLAGVYYGVLGLFAAWHRGWFSKWPAVGGAGLLALAVVAWWGSATVPDGLRITHLAVGRGTSTVLEAPDGAVWVYDAGASGNYDPGSGVLVPYLHHRGIRRVSGIILSHANLDHFGGVPSLIGSVACGPVYIAPQFRGDCMDDAPCSVLLEFLRESHHPVIELRAGDRLTLGAGVEAAVLWPPRDPPVGLAANDHSLVVRITHAGRAALLTGDIGYAAQAQLLQAADAAAPIAADLLALPHHGAVVANTRAFLAAVGAGVLVRSSFTPMAESAGLRAAVGATPVFNTADVGAVEATLDARGVRVSGYVMTGPDRESPILFNAETRH